jgi:aspartate/methionine/tyrosine aminotransferase
MNSTQTSSLFLKSLDKLGFRYTAPQGAYYVLVDISEFGAKSDLQFCEWMARSSSSRFQFFS